MSVARASDEGNQVPLGLLGMPALALALAITTVSVLIPLSLQQLTTSSLLIGAVVAGEGLIALTLPLWVGPLSDRTRTPLGGRLPYIILGAGLCAATLVLLPFTTSMVSIALLVLIFYVGYFVYYPAYRALYPDMVPRHRFGRSQGIQALCREIGMTLSLTASPILFSLWAPLPFLVCVVTLLGASATLVLRLRPILPPSPRVGPLAGARNRAVYPPPRARRVLLANALWEFALSGMKTFVVLYVVVGTGRSPAAASGLMAIVAVVAVVAAPVAGRLADRFGTLRVMRVGLYVYSLGVLLPCFTESLAVLIPAMPLVGFGGTVVMTLPYALLAESSSDQSHGTSAGWYEVSRGLGVSVGPIVTGAAIDVLEPVFQATQGYAAMWLVQGAALLLSVLLLPRRSIGCTRGDDQDGRGGPSDAPRPRDARRPRTCHGKVRQLQTLVSRPVLKYSDLGGRRQVPGQESPRQNAKGEAAAPQGAAHGVEYRAFRRPYHDTPLRRRDPRRSKALDIAR